jgi:glycosyltransferase involved in cell wall biosynthesis
MNEARVGISVIIPCYNEEPNLDELILRLNDFAASQKELELEIVFVDDCSTDDTYKKLQTYHHAHYTCRLIKLSKNCGSHIAFRAGCSIAKHDIITQTSSDLQHPLTLITDTLKSMQSNNADVVIAVRSNDYYESLFEKIFSRFYTKLVRKYAAPNYPEGGFDVFMINGRVKALLNKHVEDNSSVMLQILSFGLTQNKIRYDKAHRFKGKSKWTLTKKIKLFIDTFVAYSYAPLRLLTLTGFFLMFLGVVWSTYLIIRKITIGDLELGWPMLYSTIILGFGITNVSLGIIAEYLWRTLDAARNRPVFIIEKDELLSKH